MFLKQLLLKMPQTICDINKKYLTDFIAVILFCLSVHFECTFNLKKSVISSYLYFIYSDFCCCLSKISSRFCSYNLFINFPTSFLVGGESWRSSHCQTQNSHSLRSNLTSAYVTAVGFCRVAGQDLREDSASLRRPEQARLNRVIHPSPHSLWQWMRGAGWPDQCHINYGNNHSVSQLSSNAALPDFVTCCQ